ncbi:cation:proton antiporter [Scleromatobacter humisilvae]|uniref:Cation:proton antiporter n=1 Tax=Scleromatobacter humisilvae TaxID=2897159 RepID=A0A9X1YHS4_9BURK|nr:cation:proton antiporter [Scleromatobacter humisilvae]MCK9686141.1 cation:proton antiporter [Scleromatobacter humisilvae]
MLTATLLLLGAVLLAMCLLELHVTRLPMSPATVYLAVGWIAGWMVRSRVMTPPTAPERADMLVIITETAVLISLFAVGLQLRVPWTLKGWRVAAILASATMLVTIALATLAGVWLMPGLGWGGAVLLAGILAPTDPVLASEVQIRSRIDRDAGRVALTAEGGLNDGTSLPAVMLGLGLLGIGDLGAHGLRWLWMDLVWPIAGGALLGWAFGHVLGNLVRGLMRRGHELRWDELLYLGIITVAYGLSRLTETSSFLFVFAAALGLFHRHSQQASPSLAPVGAQTDELSDRLLAFGERCGRLVEVVMVLLMGFAMPWVQWRGEPLAYAALLLVVIRPLSVFLTQPGLPKTQRRIVAWFGIRGVGSLFYLALAIDSGLSPALCADLVNATLPAIALSVLLHGVSATPLMAIYRRRRVRQEREKRRIERRARASPP